MIVPRNIRIQIPRRFIAVNTNNSTIPIMPCRFYTADRSNEKNKSEKETKEYLEKMMDEEEASQQSSEHVDPEYWNDPGRHAVSFNNESHHIHVILNTLCIYRILMTKKGNNQLQYLTRMKTRVKRNKQMVYIYMNSDKKIQMGEIQRDSITAFVHCTPPYDQPSNVPFDIHESNKRHVGIDHTF